jgi:hypothetical protein
MRLKVGNAQPPLFADAPPEREEQRRFFAGYRRAGFQGGEHAVRKCPTEGL